MRSFRRVGYVVVLLLGVGLLLFALRSCQSDDATPTPESEPSASASPSLAPARMTTTKIESSIKTRLDEVSGRPTRVECPEKVEQKVGTAFDCDVFYDDDPGTAAVATASVEIDGPDGRYSWESTPKESP